MDARGRRGPERERDRPFVPFGPRPRLTSDAPSGPRVAALVLAAGLGRRFGGGKPLATIGGRSMVDRVLAAAFAADVDRALVVLPPGRDGDAIQARLAGTGAGTIRNRAPERGLSSSVRLGLEVLTVDETIDAVVVLPADQPLVTPDAIRAVVAAATAGGHPVAVARHAGDGAPNPVALARDAFGLAEGLAGDRGFGPVLAAHPELVTTVDLPGSNPDVDTPADLLAADWTVRVRENRAQVDRLREVPDGRDFYAPVSRLFRDDPDRTGDDVLDEIVSLVRPEDVVLDVGAGAGRYALPLARRVREVVAVEPSTAMVDALREDAAAHGIANVRVVARRWPPDGPDDQLAAVRGDVTLLAHLGYDVEPIAPFLDALERATVRTCVAVLMGRTPAAVAAPFWPAVHGEERVELPALDDLVALLGARGAVPRVTTFERPPRAYPTFDDARAAVERQLWVLEGGEKHRRFLGELRRRLVERDGGWFLEAEPARLGVVTWSPRR